MGLGPRIDIRQSQSLVLTPQLTQAIKLLQLSNLELEAYIAEELSKNPLLETPAGVSSSGFFEISSAMNASSSRLLSWRSLIACVSWGVSTSCWLWRMLKEGPKPIAAIRYSAKLSPR